MDEERHSRNNNDISRNSVGSHQRRRRRLVHVDNEQYSLSEILASSGVDKDENSNRSTADAYCLHLQDPKQCSRVLKELAHTHPLTDSSGRGGDLSHLKRVRRRPKQQSCHAQKEQQQQQQHPSSNTQLEQDTKEDKKTPSATSLSPKKKKRKKDDESSPVILEVLIGLVSSFEKDDLKDQDTTTRANFDSSSADASCTTTIDHQTSNSSISSLTSTYGPLFVVQVPKRPPESEIEFRQFNSIWPTQYLPLRTEEYKRKQLQTSIDEGETSRMQHFIEESIAKQSVLIVDPLLQSSLSPSSSKSQSNNLGVVVSDSRREQCLQEQIGEGKHDGPRNKQYNNPLATPILFAIQGVSRSERGRYIGTMAGATTSSSGTDTNGKDKQRYDDQLVDVGKSTSAVQALSESSPPVRYICTGYDVYTYYEPTVFEAMACLHSRVRHLIYYNNKGGGGDDDDDDDDDNDGPTSDSRSIISNENSSSKPWAQGCTKHSIHDLPGTNHRYRVFEYCRKIK